MVASRAIGSPDNRPFDAQHIKLPLTGLNLLQKPEDLGSRGLAQSRMPEEFDACTRQQLENIGVFCAQKRHRAAPAPCRLKPQNVHDASPRGKVIRKQDPLP